MKKVFYLDACYQCFHSDKDTSYCNELDRELSIEEWNSFPSDCPLPTSLEDCTGAIQTLLKDKNNGQAESSTENDS